ncbi:UvrB/UvrC motif-containing protein [Planctomycetota bacterium]
MMDEQNIDDILRDWPYDPSSVSVRLARGSDGRNVLQMRIEMGILQLETTGRPDGELPNGENTFYDHLIGLTIEDNDFVMNEDMCSEADREFVQFYHRRVCWLSLREFDKAVRDANHTLTLMNLCKEHSPDENWTLAREQYRPFVMFHRIQAEALGELEDTTAEKAVEVINRGLNELRDVFVDFEADEEFDESELVQRLQELRESLREKFEVGSTLREQLDAAIAAEQYELAAELRDQLAAQGKA